MAWLIAFLCLLLIALLALFLLPFGVRFDAQADGGINAKTMVQPCAPLLPWIAIPMSKQRSSEHRKKPERKKQTAHAKARHFSAQNLLARTELTWTELQRLADRTRWEKFTLCGRIGLACPADTGHLMGIVEATKPLLPRCVKQNTSLQYNFDAPEMAGEVHITAFLRPMYLVPPIVRLYRLWSHK